MIPGNRVMGAIFPQYYEDLAYWPDLSGPNNSTSIVDRSPTPKTTTVNGNAKLSTSYSVYGGSSLAFDGSNDNIDVGAVADWKFLHDGSIAWTIFGRWRFNSFATEQALFGTAITTAQTGVFAYLLTDRKISFSIARGTGSSVATVITATTAAALPNDTNFHHIEIAYDPTQSVDHCRISINGSMQFFSKAANPHSSTNPAAKLRLGEYISTSGLGDVNGNIGEFVVMKNRRFHTASFTPEVYL